MDYIEIAWQYNCFNDDDNGDDSIILSKKKLCDTRTHRNIGNGIFFFFARLQFQFVRHINIIYIQHFFNAIIST